ncbi:MAG: hypothetical protein LBT59_28505 [Clostridiales bacterium]|jgi:hypothetical protein|nr:hypothetical protein [Clostridiales bacterium]
MKRELAKFVLLALVLLTLISAEPTLAGTSRDYHADASTNSSILEKPQE